MIFLVFLVPVAVYCLLLHWVNSRCRPVLVPGAWDFAGVLFAASALLLLGGPAILTGLYQHWRLFWALGQTRFLGDIDGNWGFWVAVWTLYFVLVVGGSALLLWRRRHYLSIYNVDQELVEQSLAQVCTKLGLSLSQRGGTHVLLRGDTPVADGSHARLATSPWGSELPAWTHSLFGAERAPRTALEIARAVPPPAETGRILAGFELHAFPALRHVTLRWIMVDESLRRAIKSDLQRHLNEVWTDVNPACKWFLSTGIGLLLVVIFGVAALALLAFFHLPR